MKNIFLLLICFFCLLSCEKRPDTVFYNVNVVDVENGKIVPGMTVSVKDGIILKIKKADTRIKEGEQDLTGLYNVPGLIVHMLTYGVVDRNGWLITQVKSYIK